jgi:hypothetical protein
MTVVYESARGAGPPANDCIVGYFMGLSDVSDWSDTSDRTERPTRRPAPSHKGIVSA